MDSVGCEWKLVWEAKCFFFLRPHNENGIVQSCVVGRNFSVCVCVSSSFVIVIAVIAVALEFPMISQ